MPINRQAYEAMHAAELAYLQANGWFKHDVHDSWQNGTLERFDVTQGHAVNIQKQHDRREAYVRARLDPDRTAKPLTRLVARVDASKCINPAVSANEYIGDDGTRHKLR